MVIEFHKASKHNDSTTESIYLSICLSIHLSTYLYIYIVYLFIYLSRQTIVLMKALYTPALLVWDVGFRNDEEEDADDDGDEDDVDELTLMSNRLEGSLAFRAIPGSSSAMRNTWREVEERLKYGASCNLNPNPTP